MPKIVAAHFVPLDALIETVGCDEVKRLQILLALAVNIDPTHNPLYRSLPEVLQEKEDHLSR